MNEGLFTQYLVEAEILEPSQLDFVVSMYPDTPVLEALEQLDIITEDQIYRQLSHYLRLNYIDLVTVTPSLFAVRMVPPTVLRKYEIIPLFCDHDTLEIATACPGEWEMTEYLRFITDRDITEHMAQRHQILEMLDDVLVGAGRDLSSSSDEVLLKKQSEMRERQDPQKYLDFDDVDPRKAAVKIVNRLIKNAIYRNVSDMHVEPQKDAVTVRVRIDGELSRVTELTPALGQVVVSRIKVLSDMDITKTLEPQDGSFSVQTKNTVFDLRVSSVATPYGEKLVLRFLNPDQGKVQLRDLGLLPDVSAGLQEIGRAPQGLVIITGPTGSGKNTTLCSLINQIKSEVSNIISVEDPIEYQIEGVNQVGVNTKRGVTFASVLRALLRQDPNVIFIGEIRDQETAEIACNAAQTGHMVFSTLHTNDAVSAIARLLNMGVKRHVLSDALTAVVAQRLTRRICPDCIHSVTPTPEELQELTALGADVQHNLRRGRGCIKCVDTGFRGRVAVTEMLMIDKTIRQMISEDKSSAEIQKVALEEGFRSMWTTGLRLVSAGITTIDEFSRHVPRSEIQREKQAATDFPQKILVVDDEPSILKLCTRILSEHAAEVITASDGDYALQNVHTHQPNFILTDLNMPRVDGYTLCTKIRQDPATAQLPIIAMTGKGSTEEAECVTLEIGVDDFIRKPLKAVQLVARIRAAYRRRQSLT